MSWVSDVLSKDGLIPLLKVKLTLNPFLKQDAILKL